VIGLVSGSQPLVFRCLGILGIDRSSMVHLIGLRPTDLDFWSRGRPIPAVVHAALWHLVLCLGLRQKPLREAARAALSDVDDGVLIQGIELSKQMLRPFIRHAVQKARGDVARWKTITDEVMRDRS
jgi:hypothetical protein